jgi:transposase-like protein
MRKNYTNYTEEEKQMIKDMYEGGVNADDICEEFGIRKGSISRVAISLGAKPRRPRKSVCSKCGAPSATRDSQFCHICGNELLTEKQKILRLIDKLAEPVNLLPEASRNSFVSDIARIRAYIDKECK